MMRKCLFLSAAALAALITAGPALAKDGSGYVGFDIGAVWPKSQDLEAAVDFTNPVVPDIPFTDVGSLHMNAGVDADIIAGYDFGMFRVEGEVGYKHGNLNAGDLRQTFLDAVNGPAESTLTTKDFGLDDKTNSWSGMVNGWLDLGGEGTVGGGVGAGAGYASVHQFGGSHGTFAWQLLAQAYYPITDQLDIGLKYRFFHAGRSDGTHDFVFSGPAVCAGPGPCSGGVITFRDASRFVSHSILASLTYNFGAAPPPQWA